MHPGGYRLTAGCCQVGPIKLVLDYLVINDVYQFNTIADCVSQMEMHDQAYCRVLSWMTDRVVMIFTKACKWIARKIVDCKTDYIK